MTPIEVRRARIDKLTLTQGAFCRLLGCKETRSVRRWESGEFDVPGHVEAFLEVLLMMSVDRRERYVAERVASNGPKLRKAYLTARLASHPSA